MREAALIARIMLRHLEEPLAAHVTVGGGTA
jgi:hypothetical protein